MALVLESRALSSLVKINVQSSFLHFIRSISSRNPVDQAPSLQSVLHIGFSKLFYYGHFHCFTWLSTAILTAVTVVFSAWPLYGLMFELGKLTNLLKKRRTFIIPSYWIFSQPTSIFNISIRLSCTQHETKSQLFQIFNRSPGVKGHVLHHKTGHIIARIWVVNLTSTILKCVTQ